MRRRIVCVLTLILASSLTGCRQGDGEMPKQTGDVPERLMDIGRDIDRVAAGSAESVVELTDDLTSFSDEPEVITAVRALSSTLCPMLVNRSLNADTRSRLTTLLWTTVVARDFSERQIDRLKNDMRELLMSIGVSQLDANLVAGWVGNVQKAVTLRTRRWYERY